MDDANRFGRHVCYRYGSRSTAGTSVPVNQTTINGHIGTVVHTVAGSSTDGSVVSVLAPVQDAGLRVLPGVPTHRALFRAWFCAA